MLLKKSDLRDLRSTITFIPNFKIKTVNRLILTAGRVIEKKERKQKQRD